LGSVGAKNLPAAGTRTALIQVMQTQGIHDCIRGILSDYCELKSDAPMDLTLSIRNDLAIDSLTFVSIILRLEDSLQVDLLESGIELHKIESIGDLIDVGQSLQKSSVLTVSNHKESA
jgi:acyl carrier protein